MRLRGSVIDVNRLTSPDRQRMFHLMQLCYENIQQNKFEEDLNAKSSVIQVHDPSTCKLVGFSTQVMLKAIVDDKPVRALFSGDTVIKPSHWGDPALAHEWGQLALRFIDQYSSERLYWFLTSKGFRTYKYLPLFFQQYFPRSGEELTLDQANVIDAFGQLVGGQRYDHSRKVILSTPDKDYVRRGVSDPGARMDSDLHVRFFLERNPGYMQGDELCCIAPLSRQNFTRMAYRVINVHAADREAV